MYVRPYSSDSSRVMSSSKMNPRPSVSTWIGASGVSQGGRTVGVGKKAGIGVGVGENIVVIGIGVDENTGVDMTLETAVGADVRNVDMEVSKELKIADVELIARDGVGVDITRDGIVIELEEKANVVGCGVGVTIGVLDMAGIWLVSEKGSNDRESPEPKSRSPEPSGVIETIGILLLNIMLPVLENIRGMDAIGALDAAVVSAVVCVMSIRLPEEVKGCDIN